MVKVVDYESMDFVDQKRLTQRRLALNNIMDRFGLPHYMGDLYLEEVKKNINNEKAETIDILKIQGLLDVEN